MNRIHEKAVEITNRVATTGYTAANIRWVEAQLMEISLQKPSEAPPAAEKPLGVPTWPDEDEGLLEALQGPGEPKRRRK